MPDHLYKTFRIRLLSQLQQGVWYPRGPYSGRHGHGLNRDTGIYARPSSGGPTDGVIVFDGRHSTMSIETAFPWNTMSDFSYKGYTIKLRSLYDPMRTKWEPLAIVWWNEEDRKIGHPIASAELQDTEALADAVALKRAKAWVDAREQ